MKRKKQLRRKDDRIPTVILLKPEAKEILKWLVSEGYQKDVDGVVNRLIADQGDLLFEHQTYGQEGEYILTSHTNKKPCTFDLLGYTPTLVPESVEDSDYIGW
jgi:hypothetical protein